MILLWFIRCHWLSAVKMGCLSLSMKVKACQYIHITSESFVNSSATTIYSNNCLISLQAKLASVSSTWLVVYTASLSFNDNSRFFLFIYWLFISMFVQLLSQLLIHHPPHPSDSYSFPSLLSFHNLSTFLPTPSFFWSHLVRTSIQTWSIFSSPCADMSFILSSTQLATILEENPCPHIWCLSLLHPPDPSFPLLHLPPIPLFLSSIHLWSLSSSPLSTSDPPFPHFPALWSQSSPELWGMSLCVSCLCRSLHVWWPRGRDDTAPLEWEGTESGRSSTNALLNPLQYTMSSS